MPPNAIPNAYAFAYRGRNSSASLDLHRWCVGVSDQLLSRIARHVYLKRDGAEKEPMGAGDGAYRLRLNIVGNDVAAQYRAIVIYCRDNPQGTLTHALLGELKVACEGVESADLDIASARNAVSLSIKFTDDAVDAAITANDTLGATTAAGDLSAQATSLTTIGTTVTAVAALTSDAASKATALVSAALGVYRATTGTTSLDKQVGDVKTSAAALEEGVLASDAYSNDAERFDAIDAARRTHAAALALQEAVQRTGPRIVSYMVPATMPLSAIAVQLYGKDGAAHLDELRRLNRITNPFAVAGGTVLQVAQPTV